MDVSNGNAEHQQEKQRKVSRDNQQMLVYLLVAMAMILSWVLGRLEFAFMWTFALIVLTFFVWHNKVMQIVEKQVKYKELQLHRKRALRHGETTEWLNLVINRWWTFSASSITTVIKRNLDPLLHEVKPAYIENIELQSFVIGDTPHIKYLKVYDASAKRDGTLHRASWLTGGGGGRPSGSSTEHHLVLEGDVGLHSEDFKVVFKTRLGSKWMGLSLDVILEKLNITGCMQFVLTLNKDTPFPHISNVAVSFRDKPEVWFNIRMLKAVQMMEIPMLKSWIHSLVMDGLTEALVDPGKIDIEMASTYDYAPSKAKSKTRAQGVLTVTVSSDQTKGNMFSDASRYCVLRVGDQRETLHQTQGPVSWSDTRSFLVESLTSDKLLIKCKAKRLLSTYNLAQFDLSLADFPFEHQACVETTVEEKTSRWQASNSIKLHLQLNYSPLPAVESHIEQLETQPQQNHLVVSGVLYVCIHSAANLLALDRNGTSDPYCIIFRNGKKLKTTHYVCRTRSPTWEVNAEFLVNNFSRNMLSFMVYDWDGHNASEDDFLGSAYFLPSHDEPFIIRKHLTLGYNVLNQGQVDNIQLGSICVSVVFRPVENIALKSDFEELTNADTANQLDKHKMFMNSAVLVHASLQWSKQKPKQNMNILKDKKSLDTMGVGNLLSMGHGLLELNILQAKDLVPMDSNGFSDPYVEVKIGSERKFTTTIKKKTLNPVWEEWVTMQLPKHSERLDIIVWDRDPLFQKDFLGSLSFTLDDLKKSASQTLNDGWYKLERIRSGYIQLHFKVISEEMQQPGSHYPLNVFGEPSATNGTSDQGACIGDAASSHPPPPVTTSKSLSPLNELSSFAAKLSSAMAAVRLDKSSPQRVKLTRSQSLHEDLPNKSSCMTLPARLTPVTSSIRLTPSKSYSFRLKRGNAQSDSQGTTDGDISPGNKYYGVHGRILRTEGHQGNSPAYCKIRLDSRSQAERSRKTSLGRTLCKTKKFDKTTKADTVSFILDDGVAGVVCDALLIVDIKSSSRSHIITRGFLLSQLLQDVSEVTTWLELDDSIKVEIYLCAEGARVGDTHAARTPTAQQRNKEKTLRKRKVTH